MTLHEAIIKVLKSRGREMTTTEIAYELNRNKWYQKKDGSDIIPYQIHGRTKNYPIFFKRNGSVVSLVENEVKCKQPELSNKNRREKPKQLKSGNSDEFYILGLCDEILGYSSSRQHKFDFLKGDMNQQGKSSFLPVDAYYEELKLVIEYREKQHSESVSFFDKPNKITVSGVNRGEQRKIYDQRRRDILPKNGIKLIEISYSDFNYDKQKRIIRDKNKDSDILKHIINEHIN
ncbi:HTH domain-containing protein [Empedobacter tilapiae]|uniref:HTH domain-containing protein n=1 Tax=Empedobacter tilapiae TaxID=2491114 RepID=UPI0028D0BF17|nr:HTH domain-containing protein [Empedobacter tilapiae]